MSLDRGAGRGRRRWGGRGRPPNTPAWAGNPFNPHQCSSNPSTTTNDTTRRGCHQNDTLHFITRFCQPPGTAPPTTRYFMGMELMAQVLRLLQDASPSQREQLFWDVYTQLAEYFGQPHLPLRSPQDSRSLTRLAPRPWNRLFLPSLAPSNRYQEDFEQVEVLGRGGFGCVVKARNRLDGCCYAVKIIIVKDSEDRFSPARYQQEVEALAQLHHPRVVRYHCAWLQLDLHPSPDSPWAPVSASASGSDGDDDDGDDDSGSQAETSSSGATSADGNGVSPCPTPPRQESHASSDDSIVFLSSGNGRGLSHSHRQRTPSPNITSSRSHTRTQEGTCSVALLPYHRPQTMPCLRRVLYIQMGLCGKSLKDWLEERETSPCTASYSRCLGIFREVLEALSYIHQQDLIHRDVKPANIFFTLEGQHVQLGDFGLAKESARPPPTLAPTTTTTIMARGTQQNTSHVGTPLYTAPEADRGIYGQKSDMFSAGVILLELVSFFPTNHQRVKDISDLITMRRLDPQLTLKWPDITHWILKLTDPEPANRPSSEELLASPLFARPFPTPPPPPPQLPPLPSPIASDATIAPPPAPPDTALTNGALAAADGGMPHDENLQWKINRVKTLAIRPVVDSETLQVSRVEAESTVAVHTVERFLSTDEENAVLREENVALKRRVEELSLEVQRLRASNSTLPPVPDA